MRRRGAAAKSLAVRLVCFGDIHMAFRSIERLGTVLREADWAILTGDLTHFGDPPDAFPDPQRALHEPDGLLAVGGDLDPARLLAAYRRGIFPWYEAGQPILWWSPDPRLVLELDEIKISRSLRKTIKKRIFSVTFDQAFSRVIAACASVVREGQPGTWITAEMREAYERLHTLGYAHSVETWLGDELAGGLYGVSSDSSNEMIEFV